MLPVWLKLKAALSRTCLLRFEKPNCVSLMGCERPVAWFCEPIYLEVGQLFVDGVKSTFPILKTQMNVDVIPSLAVVFEFNDKGRK